MKLIKSDLNDCQEEIQIVTHTCANIIHKNIESNVDNDVYYNIAEHISDNTESNLNIPIWANHNFTLLNRLP